MIRARSPGAMVAAALIAVAMPVIADDDIPAFEGPPADAPPSQETICTQWQDAPEGQTFEPTVVDIHLDGYVGSHMANQLFDTVQEALTYHQSLKTINILLSSRGGETAWGIKIHNYLQGLHQRYGLQVVTHNTYSIESVAIDIYCAGNQRIASPHSYFMVHDLSLKMNEGTYDLGTIRDHEEMSRIESEAGHTLVSSCTNLPVADVEEMFADATYFGTDRALEIGMVHSVIPATFNRDAAYICEIEGVEEEHGE